MTIKNTFSSCSCVQPLVKLDLRQLRYCRIKLRRYQLPGHKVFRLLQRNLLRWCARFSFAVCKLCATDCTAGIKSTRCTAILGRYRVSCSYIPRPKDTTYPCVYIPYAIRAGSFRWRRSASSSALLLVHE